VNKYSIPKIFFKKYFYELTSKTFCFLIKLYQNYLDGAVAYYHDLKDQTFDSFQEMEEAYAELIANNIITYNRVYNKKKSCFKYIIEYKDEPITFEVVYQIKPRKKGRNISEKFIENTLSKFSERVREKLKKMVEGTVAYYLKTRSTVKTKKIYELLLPFFEAEDAVICKVCDIYVNKYYSKKPVEYIHGILNNVREDKKEIKNESLDKYKQEQEESERRLAIKIVCGKVEENVAYKALLQCKDFKELNRLYKIGTRYLKENDRANEISTNYNWIES
jgi:hypothetical protein